MTAAAPTRPRPLDAAHWQQRLAELCERHRVPGAQLGVLRLGTGAGGADDELLEVAHGVLHLGTGVPVTTDSLFQIGSISKVWTATLAAQLADEGRLDLDAPVAAVLPQLRLADPEAQRGVTMRHLLTHTSGIDGDVFTDTGRGDDCLERYVALLGDAAQNHPLGATWSYCNSGFVLAGRVIEVVTGGTWDAALRERLLTPLGLERTVTLPEEALLHSTAVGHVGEGDEPLRPTPVWGMPRCLGPAGLIDAAVGDLLAFARMHLTGGLAADGTRVLAESTVADMAAEHAQLPDTHSLGDSWGLGWIRFGWDGHRLIGHDGGTYGQGAVLRMLPEQGLALGLTTNGGNLRDLYHDLVGEVLGEVAGVAVPAPLEPPQEPVSVDASRHVGVYERHSVRMEVLDGDGDGRSAATGGLRLRTTVSGPVAEVMGDAVDEDPLVPVGPDLFVTRSPGVRTWTPVTFYELPTGQRYLHAGARATPRTS